jgi:hypothetical protein
VETTIVDINSGEQTTTLTSTSTSLLANSVLRPTSASTSSTSASVDDELRRRFNEVSVLGGDVLCDANVSLANRLMIS